MPSKQALEAVNAASQADIHAEQHEDHGAGHDEHHHGGEAADHHPDLKHPSRQALAPIAPRIIERNANARAVSPDLSSPCRTH